MAPRKRRRAAKRSTVRPSSRPRVKSHPAARVIQAGKRDTNKLTRNISSNNLEYNATPEIHFCSYFDHSTAASRQIIDAKRTKPVKCSGPNRLGIFKSSRTSRSKFKKLNCLERADRLDLFIVFGSDYEMLNIELEEADPTSSSPREDDPDEQLSVVQPQDTHSSNEITCGIIREACEKPTQSCSSQNCVERTAETDEEMFSWIKAADSPKKKVKRTYTRKRPTRPRVENKTPSPATNRMAKKTADQSTNPVSSRRQNTTTNRLVKQTTYPVTDEMVKQTSNQSTASATNEIVHQIKNETENETRNETRNETTIQIPDNSQTYSSLRGTALERCDGVRKLISNIVKSWF